MTERCGVDMSFVTNIVPTKLGGTGLGDMKGELLVKRDLKADLKKMDELVLGWHYYPQTLKEFEARDRFNDFTLNNAREWLVSAIDKQERADKLETILRKFVAEVEQDEADGIPVSKSERRMVMRAKEVLGNET